MGKKCVSLKVLKELVKEMVESKSITINVGNFYYKGKEYSVGVDLKEARG